MTVPSISLQNYFQRYAFISLGANLDSSFGSPRDSIQHAISLIAEFSKEVLIVSSFIEAAPLDCPPDSPMFTNAVLGLIPDEGESALSLLRRLQAIEDAVGRTRSGLVNEARVLDLDLITFKEEESDLDELFLPHPRACMRSFVLQPLRELTGNIVFPGQSLLIDELLNNIQA